MIQLTQGQPYLLQLMGHTLITYLNRQRPISGEEAPIFSGEDLETVLASPEFYTAGSAYFRGIWLQAQHSPLGGQLHLLHHLASHTRGRASTGWGLQTEQLLNAVKQTSGLTLAQLQDALKMLVRHDVIQSQDGRCGYRVELMRRWVAQKLKTGQLRIPD